MGQKNENLHQRIEILQRQMGALVPASVRPSAAQSNLRERSHQPAFSEEESEGDEGNATDGGAFSESRRCGANKNTEGRAARRRRCRARRAAELAALATATELEEDGLCPPLLPLYEQNSNAASQEPFVASTPMHQFQQSAGSASIWVPPSLAAARTRERAERQAHARGAGVGSSVGAVPPLARHGDDNMSAFNCSSTYAPMQYTPSQQGYTTHMGGAGRGGCYGEGPKVIAPPMQSTQRWQASFVGGSKNAFGHGAHGYQNTADGF